MTPQNGINAPKKIEDRPIPQADNKIELKEQGCYDELGFSYPS
jgi:hypothetical protein